MKMIIDNTKKYEEIKNIKESILLYKENSLIWEPFYKGLMLHLSWSTNSLEGNTINLDETIALLAYDEVHAGHTYTEYQEIKSAYRVLCEKLKDDTYVEIDIPWIKKSNAVFLNSSGEYRINNVYVGTIAEAVYYPPDFTKIPELMKKWNADLEMESTDNQKSICQIAKKHIEFERIHPFPDGNGRTGRLILNQQLLNYGWLPAIIKAKSKYRQAFRQYDKNGDISMMEKIILDGILESYMKLEEVALKYNNEFQADKQTVNRKKNRQI